MRLKGEEPEELAGFVAALRDAARGAWDGEPAAGGLVACAGAFDGVAEAPALSLAAAAVAAACGAHVVVHCGTTLGPKRGVTPADVLGALGGVARPDVAASRATLDRAGCALVHAGEAIPGWERLAAVRDEVGLRGPVHTAEKLVDVLGARRFVVGHTHGAYGARIVGALGLLGAEAAVAVRGLEGSDVLRPGRPSAQDARGPLDLPERLGARVTAPGGAEASAALTRALLDGDEDGPEAWAVALSAGLRLWVAGVADDPAGGGALARRAMAGGRASATLDALVSA
jgi:anthranilate phosphoribosyltransferase